MATDDSVKAKFPVGSGFTHEAPQELLRINKYHFLLVLRRMQDQERRTPKGEWCVIPASAWLALTIPLISSNFKDALGIARFTWAAIVLILWGVTALATVGLFVWWLVDAVRHRDKTPEQLLNDVIDEMTSDRERAAKLIGAGADAAAALPEPQ